MNGAAATTSSIAQLGARVAVALVMAALVAAPTARPASADGPIDMKVEARDWEQYEKPWNFEANTPVRVAGSGSPSSAPASQPSSAQLPGARLPGAASSGAQLPGPSLPGRTVPSNGASYPANGAGYPANGPASPTYAGGYPAMSTAAGASPVAQQASGGYPATTAGGYPPAHPASGVLPPTGGLPADPTTAVGTSESAFPIPAAPATYPGTAAPGERPPSMIATVESTPVTPPASASASPVAPPAALSAGSAGQPGILGVPDGPGVRALFSIQNVGESRSGNFVVHKYCQYGDRWVSAESVMPISTMKKGESKPVEIDCPKLTTGWPQAARLVVKNHLEPSKNQDDNEAEVRWGDLSTAR
jgi:hypothetical protein